MAKPDGTFLYVATYPDEVSAREDYQIVKGLHSQGLVGSYDAAVITKDAAGKVHENKDAAATGHGAWWGVAAGAAVGVLFPPSVLGAAAVGGVIGGMSGHLAKGMSRARAKELGDFIDPGQAGLIVIGETTIDGYRGSHQGRQGDRRGPGRQTIGYRQDLAGDRQKHVATSPNGRGGAGSP